MTLDYTDYQPNRDVVAQLRQVRFVAVVGPSAAGKSTVIEHAVERDPSVQLVLSTTSRLPREGEREGVDYHFQGKAAMLERIHEHEYVQVAPSLFGDLYATAPEDYSTKGVSVLPVLADAVPTFRKLPFQAIRVVFVLPPDFDTWQARIQNHGFTPEQLQKRLGEAARSLQFACDDPDMLFVLNDDIDVATEEFLLLLRGATADSSQQEACRNLAATLLRNLEQVQRT